MFRKSFFIGFRTLRRKPFYTFLNVSGLAIGMAVCILIGLYVHDELQFDRFHKHAGRIVQIGYESSFMGGRGLATSYPLKYTLQEHVPSIERATHFLSRTHRITDGSQELVDDFDVLYGEPSFFQMFTFKTVLGNASDALNHPDGIIITKSVAQTFFGEGNPIGKTLLFSEETLSEAVTVLAVVEDPPSRSTIQFDMIVSLQRLPEYLRRTDGWGAFMYSTYALLNEQVDAELLATQIHQALEPHYDNPTLTFAIPLTSVYLSEMHRVEGFRGEIKYLYIFGFAALFVLLIAGINYINLATAQGMKRALEVGIRKTLGVTRFQLAQQFLIESILVGFIALLLALLLVEAALPAFNTLFEKNLTIFHHGWIIAALCAFVTLIAIASGSYPAFFLSRFQPIRVMHGQAHTIAAKGNLLRKFLIVLQFTVSFLLIIGVSVIYYQLHYIQTKDLGFDGDYVALIDLRGQEPWRLRDHLRERLLAHPAIRSATVTQAVPGQFHITLGLKPEGLSTQIESEQETILFNPAVVDDAFFETLGMQLIAGRDFSPDLATDREHAYILNETAVRSFGWTPEEAIGKSFGIRETGGEIIGVVEDFHLRSFHHEVTPVVFQIHEGSSWSTNGIIAAKLESGNVREGILHIQETLAEFAPGVPFDYHFLDDSIRAMYQTEKRLSQVVLSFAILSILVACLGLYGLAAFTAEQRTKEIGIRKILGATVTNIVFQLSKEYTKLVVIAVVIAVPVSYNLMSRWLEDFAYRIEMTWWLFTLAGGLALAIALLTVSYQVIRAATANPVESLRYE